LGFYEKQIEQTPLDFHHWLSLLAPRPVMVIAGDQDTIFPNCEKLRPAFDQVQHVYALCGAPDRFSPRIFNGPHNFPPDLKAEAWKMFHAALAHEGT
jgi:hypothetical protein